MDAEVAVSNSAHEIRLQPVQGSLLCVKFAALLMQWAVWTIWAVWCVSNKEDFSEWSNHFVDCSMQKNLFLWQTHVTTKIIHKELSNRKLLYDDIFIVIQSKSCHTNKKSAKLTCCIFKQ